MICYCIKISFPFSTIIRVSLYCHSPFRLTQMYRYGLFYASPRFFLLLFRFSKSIKFININIYIRSFMSCVCVCNFVEYVHTTTKKETKSPSIISDRKARKYTESKTKREKSIRYWKELTEASRQHIAIV